MTKRGSTRAGEHLTPRQELVRSALIGGPAVLWQIVFVVGPLLGVVVLSFLTRGSYGQVQSTVTLESFRRLIGYGAFGFEPLYLTILTRTVLLAAATVGLSIAGGLPLAFFIAGLPARWRQAALIALVIPFWTNLLIRTYAWQIILSSHGWVARVAAATGLVAPGTALYPGIGAVLIGLTCDYLPFLTLPLYASVEKIDWTLAEAASDLGANAWGVFRHALLPQMKPGLIAGSLLVFIPATGQFVIPDLLGGAKTVLLGNAIQQQFGASRDWPFGSAMACVGMALVMGGLWLYTRAVGSEETPQLS